MPYLSLAGLQLELEIEDNLSLIEKEIALAKKRFPWVQMVVLPELFALTELVGDLILEDLERTVEATVDTVRADYAVLAGIQIHGPEGTYVQPRTMYTVVDRQRREIELARPG